MRELAEKGDYKNFERGIDSNDKGLIKDIYDAVRKGLK
jgi:hypothetical protein